MQSNTAAGFKTSNYQKILKTGKKNLNFSYLLAAVNERLNTTEDWIKPFKTLCCIKLCAFPFNLFKRVHFNQI